MRGRFASGILRRLGMAELIAASDQEYVELIVRLARDRELQPTRGIVCTNLGTHCSTMSRQYARSSCF